jgi:predicted MFS family arabinose efflux permease
MVIYTPLYMSTVLEMAWSDIGRILFVGLMAYVLLEYVIGVIADTRLGEKEMMAVGFLILTVSTSWFAFLQDAPIILWMIAMFMTRVGASLVEVTTESYFFKHTNGSDSALISFFRITRPLATVIGAILGTVTLVLINRMELLFVVLGLLMIPGFFFTMGLRDTR